MAGLVYGKDQPTSLGWQSLCMPIPQDFELNTFLQKLADEITDEDLQKLKTLLHGDGGLQRRVLEGITSPVDFLTVLKERMYLNRENMIFLQACLWNIGRRDLHRKCVEFAKSSDKILHFYCPKETLENGYQFIKFHVAGGLDTFQRPHLDHVRRTVAQLLGCQPEHVFVAGIEPSNSLVVTLMVPAAYVDLVPCADRCELGFLRTVDVDKITIKEGIEIEIPCFGSYHAKEIRHILRKNRDLESQLDKANRTLLDLEKEKRQMTELGSMSEAQVSISKAQGSMSKTQGSMSKAQGSLSRSLPGLRPSQLFSERLDFSILSSSTPLKSPISDVLQPSSETPIPAFQVSQQYVGGVLQGQTSLSYNTQLSMEKGSDIEYGGSYTNSIKVSNLPPDVIEEELREYFERRQDQGGGPVKYLSMSSQKGEAVVSFRDSRDVERLLQSKPLLFKTHYIKVEPYHSGDDSSLNLTGLAEPETSLVEQDACNEPGENLAVTLEVSGFKPEVREETLEDYFENKKSGGKEGSLCLPIKMEADRSVAYVRFKDRDVAQSVLLKENHMLNGVRLVVKERVQRRSVTQSKVYKDKVFVTGIDPKTTQDGLENYLHNRANTPVSDIIRGEDGTKAVATFTSDIDFHKLQEMCKTKSLDQKYLTVEKVKVTHGVLVRNVLDTTTEDCLGMHFQYRVNGGKISQIQRQGEDSFLVWFTNPSATDVCSQYHKVDGQELEVSLYYECLGVSRNSSLQLTFTAPANFMYDPQNDAKLMFLETSPKAQEVLKSTLEQQYALAEVQTEGKKKMISVRCCLTYDVSECMRRARKWKKKVQKELDEFFNNIVIESLSPLREIWEEVEKKKEELEREASGSVVIRLNADLLEVKVIGWKEDVSVVTKNLKLFIKNANENLEKIKNEITEEFCFKNPLSVQIFKITKFCEESRSDFPNCHTELDEKNLRVNFVGLPTDVYKAKCSMLELFHKRSKVPVGPFSQEKLRFLESPKIKGYLEKKIEEKKLHGLYEIRKDRYIEVNAETDEQAVEMAHFIKSFIIETPRKVSKFDGSLLTSSMFQTKIKELESDYNGLVTILPDAEKLVIKTLMVSEVEKNILELLDNFLLNNVMVGEAIEVPSAMIRYLQLFCLEDLENIMSKFKAQYHAQVFCTGTTICVIAQEAGLVEVETQVIGVIQKIVKRTEKMELPSVVKYLRGESAQQKVDYVEHEFQCIITAGKESCPSTPIQKQLSREKDTHQLASCELESGRKIIIVKQDLTDLEVDVIVNAADSELKLAGGLALVIAQKGGDDISLQCQKRVREKGPLSNGEVFCCMASGQLKCRAVVHAVGPVWEGGKNQEDVLLGEVIYSSLETCDSPQNQFRSIAIPAISTGVFNYPREQATQVIIDTIKDYFNRNKDSVISEVYLCDIKSLVVEAFTAALEKSFRNVDVRESQKQAWKRLKDLPDKPSGDPDNTLIETLTQMDPKSSSIELTLYGHDENQLLTAFGRLQELMREDYKWKDFDDPLLKDLNSQQKSKLQFKATELGVKIDFNKLQRIGRIKLHGLKQDVFEMEEIIHKLLKKQGEQKQNEREMAYFQSVVQWKRKFKDGQEMDCPPMLNMNLEKYFRQKEKRIRFAIASEEFTVDLTEMSLYSPENPKDVSQLYRSPKPIEKVKTTFPVNWSPMADDDNLVTVPLNHSKQEYQDIIHRLDSALAGRCTIPSDGLHVYTVLYVWWKEFRTALCLNSMPQ
uniref:Poly [ADP-ribose] polymerase 14-like isoform X4 n=1 Tax=Crassostrea virginica TaxID=6565 RepID=A0A8B8B896_CRAVI|nr:poly [ADP-ribose] polymerase 14-like isoform X4 [Crassostrea virginica]